MASRNSTTAVARHSIQASRIERRSIVALLLVMVPLLAALIYGLSLGSEQRVEVGGLTEAYVDLSGAKTLSDLLAQPTLFSPADGSAPNMGVRTTPETAFWLRLPLADLRELVPSGASAPFALSMEEPRFRSVDLYIVGPQTRVVEQRFRRDANTSYRYPIFKISGEALAAEALYARIVTGSSMRATLYLAPEQDFVTLYARSTIGLALLLGMMGATIAYLLPLGLVLRQGIYFALAASMLFAGLYVASDQAMLETHILPGAVVVSRALSLSATVLFYGAFLSFSVRFLYLGRRAWRVRRTVDIVAGILLMVGVAAFLDGLADTGLLRRGLPYIGMAAAAVLAGLLALGARHAPRRAALFVILWLPLVVTGMLRIQLDTAPGQAASPTTLNGLYFGLALSLLLFSVVTPLELYRREARLRKRTQALLQRLESFASIGRDIYVEVDASGKLVYFAGGQVSEPYPDEDWHLNRAADGALPARAQDVLREAARSMQPLNNHIFTSGPPDDPRWYSLSGASASDAPHFRAVLRDVTIAIEQENQRQQERHLISLGSLAAIVAHEINNVIQPIVNMSKGLRDHVASAPAAGRMLDLIDLAAQQAVTLVGQILKVGARDSDPAIPGRAIDMAVQDAIATLRLILPASTRLETRIEAAPNVIVRPGDILQILINVIANARRASGDDGAIVIDLVARTDGATLSVIDDGEGMSPALLARVTDHFVTTKPDGRLAGIGLTVVKQLVAGHGGTLAIASEPGQGSRIEMFFPAPPGDAT